VQFGQSEVLRASLAGDDFGIETEAEADGKMTLNEPNLRKWFTGSGNQAIEFLNISMTNCRNGA